MEQPLLTVLVFSYNQKDYIRQTLDGILMQECDFDFKVVVNDDASTDGTADIINEYAKSDSPIIANLRLVNLGGMMNAYLAVQEVDTEFVAICDGDDYWIDPRKLSKQMAVLSSQENIFAVGSTVKVQKASGKLIEPGASAVRTYSFKDLLKKNRLSTCTVMLRNRNVRLEKWFTEMVYGDWIYWLLSMKPSEQIIVFPEPVAVYRDFSGMTSQRSKERLRYLNGEISIYRNLLKLAKFRPFQKEINHEIGYREFLKIKHLRKAGNNSMALSSAYKSLRILGLKWTFKTIKRFLQR